MSTRTVGTSDGTEFTYPQLYSMSEFLTKYGEDNCALMLVFAERQYYRDQAEAVMGEFEKSKDAAPIVQDRLDAWQPLLDRDPTELEMLAATIAELPPEAQTVWRRHLDSMIAAQDLKLQESRVETAQAENAKLQEQFQQPPDVGPPVTETEPKLQSFEEAGKDADNVIATAQAAQDVAIVESSEAYAAPVAQEEGGDEGVVIPKDYPQDMDEEG